MTDGFKDHFSGHARAYARHRPSYPAALYAALAALAPTRALAWDCATGNGQAARGLAQHFARVVATDASAEQIAAAAAQPKVEYRVAPAEHSGLAPDSVDLITVAQALHWFDLEAFYREVARVARPGGILAVWCYGLTRVTPAVDAVVDDYYRNIVGPYWPPERAHIEAGYRTLAFPFEAIELPPFHMEQSWSLGDFEAYLATWSATQRFHATRGSDPLVPIDQRLRQAWRTDSERAVTWPLALRVGRIK